MDRRYAGTGVFDDNGDSGGGGGGGWQEDEEERIFGMISSDDDGSNNNNNFGGGGYAMRGGAASAEHVPASRYFNTAAATAASAQAEREADPLATELRLPRSGAPSQELYDFLSLWRRRAVARLDREDKTRAEWLRMCRFLAHPMNGLISSRRYGKGKAGRSRMTYRATMPEKAFAQEIFRRVAEHWEERPGELFVLPPSFAKTVRYKEETLTLSGLTAFIARIFFPEGRPSFENIPERRTASNYLRKNGRVAQSGGRNACAGAGSNHGTRVHNEIETIVKWMNESKDLNACNLIMQRLPGGLDFCTLRLLKFLDATGRVPIRSEHVVCDPALLIGSPIDLICWQCEGFGRLPGCQFVELKTGYECGPFERPVPSDKKMQYLTALDDTPYMRAVLQMISLCIFAAQRYDGYVSEEQCIIHISPRRGEVREYGMPGWVEDEKNAILMYQCMNAYVPVAHRIRVCSGMKFPTQFSAPSSVPATELAATAAAAAGLYAGGYSADDWSFISERHLTGEANFEEGAEEEADGYDSDRGSPQEADGDEEMGYNSSDADEAEFAVPSQPHRHVRWGQQQHAEPESMSDWRTCTLSA